MKKTAMPYIRWIYPKDDFVIEDGYDCIPPALGHSNEKWAVFRTPKTSDEMGRVIAIEEDRFKKELEYFANSRNVSAETRIGLLLGITLRRTKRIGELYEQKGELKFSDGVADIKLFLGKELLIWRKYICRIKKWEQAGSGKPPPRPPKSGTKIREAFINAWRTYKESVKGVCHATAKGFFESDILLMPINGDSHSLAEYYPTIEAIKAELHAVNQNRRNAKIQSSGKAKRAIKNNGKAMRKQKRHP